MTQPPWARSQRATNKMGETSSRNLFGYVQHTYPLQKSRPNDVERRFLSCDLFQLKVAKESAPAAELTAVVKVGLTTYQCKLN